MSKIIEMMQPLTEDNLVKDICDKMKEQIKKENIGKLLIYGGSLNQASVLAQRVRISLDIPSGNYIFYNLIKSPDFEINPNIRLITLISIFEPKTNNNLRGYYQINLEESLKYMENKIPEECFTHI